MPEPRLTRPAGGTPSAVSATSRSQTRSTEPGRRCLPTPCGNRPGFFPDRRTYKDTPMTERILITGAGGRIGTLLRPRMVRPGRILRLHDRRPLEPGPGVEIVTCDATDLDAMTEAMDGVDAVVHLAARSTEAP